MLRKTPVQSETFSINWPYDIKSHFLKRVKNHPFKEMNSLKILYDLDNHGWADVFFTSKGKTIQFSTYIYTDKVERIQSTYYKHGVSYISEDPIKQFLEMAINLKQSNKLSLQNCSLVALLDEPGEYFILAAPLSKTKAAVAFWTIDDDICSFEETKEKIVLTKKIEATVYKANFIYSYIK